MEQETIQTQETETTPQEGQQELTPQQYVDHVIMLEMKVREIKALVEYDEYLTKFNNLKQNTTNE